MFGATAEQSDPNSHPILGGMNIGGEGIIQDPSQAYLWLILAASGGDKQFCESPDFNRCPNCFRGQAANNPARKVKGRSNR